MTTQKNAIQAQETLIVLVDDDDAIAEFLHEFINMETSYHLIRFGNSQEVLQQVDELARLRPSLFLLDYKLPTMTAITLYDYLHSLPELHAVPAIIFTAYQESKITKELQQRNLFFLSKPFDIDVFLSLLEQCLALQKKL